MTDRLTGSGSGPRPAERYGDGVRRPYGWLLKAGVVVLVAAAIAWWLWIAVVRSTPAVSWSLIGFDAVTDTSVEVRWTVDRDPAVDVECVLRARDASGTEVGRVRVPVPTSGATSIEMEHTVTTAGRAVTGEVLLCATRSD